MNELTPHRLKQLYWALRKAVRDWQRMTAPQPVPAQPVLEHPATKYACDLVLDVGANSGQYAMMIRRQGYSGRILSFEPLSSAHRKLQEKSDSDPLWEIHPRCALGRAAGEAEINIAGNSVSSSLLPMLTLHAEAAPQSVYTSRETTPVITLDSAIEAYLGTAKRVYLKMDTQGYEAEVLSGLQQKLPLIQAIELELSLSPLYAGQASWRDLTAQIERAGFVLMDMRKAFADPRTGQLLQMDGLFVRPPF